MVYPNVWLWNCIDELFYRCCIWEGGGKEVNTDKQSIIWDVVMCRLHGITLQTLNIIICCTIIWCSAARKLYAIILSFL
jgi:hypothetical protein